MPDEHPILLHIEEGVARITLNRPPHNALNEQLLKELKAVTSQIEHNSDVWLVVVAGSGNKAFCAGGDLKWMHHKSPQEWNTIAHKLIQGGINAVAGLSVPVVAAVDGFALGGGFELALACDIVLASEAAQFGLPEIKLGIFPGGGGTQRLAKVVGLNKAKELIFTGRSITGEEARDLNIVSRVIPRGEMEKAIGEMVTELRQVGSDALKLAKRAINFGVNSSLDEGLRHEADLVSLCFATSDQQEGFAAFMERRTPSFHQE